LSLLVTTDLRRLGRALPNSADRVEILEASFQLLKTYTGNDSAWLPAYNFELTSTGFGKHEPEAITTGALNSYIWREKSEWKTQDPIFSMVGWGRKPSTFELQASELEPYGNGSVFEELINGDIQLLSFGLGISDGATFMHMVETNRPQGPMYRYWKTFDGIYELNGQLKSLSLRLHCRPAGYELEYDLPRLNADLIANNIVTVVNPELSIYLGNISEIYHFWVERATKDPYYLLTPRVAETFSELRRKIGRDFLLEDFE
jgi:hypothetical protein